MYERPDEDWSEAILAAMNGEEDPNYYPDDEEEYSEVDEENDMRGADSIVDVEELNQREKAIQEHRAGARKSQQKQAEKMKEATNNRYWYRNL